MKHKKPLFQNLVIGAGLSLFCFYLTTGCSENIEQGLYPESDSNITISAEASGLHNGLLEIGSAASPIQVTVTSTTRWTVEVTECDGAWCQITYGNDSDDSSEQIGNGYFIIEAAANRSDKVRDCKVTVYAVDREGNHVSGQSVEINLEQDRQSISLDYAGDVISPYGTTASTEPVVTITANQAWSVISSHSWVIVIPSADMDGNTYNPESNSSEEKSISFRFKVDGNPGTSTRTAELTISSPTSAFTPQRLNVTQEGSTETFFITPTNVPEISFQGGVVEFQVYSPRENWTVQTMTTGDWVQLDRTSGEASTDPVIVRATVGPNSETDFRQAGVIFTRAGDKGQTTITMTQGYNPETPNPNHDPVVSTAWIVSGWTMFSAQLRAFYLSPAITLTGGGAYINPVTNENEVRTVQGTMDTENRLLIVDIDDLVPNTEYKAWPFVEYYVNGSKLISTGGATFFTTPSGNGVPDDSHPLPDPDDNNPPSIN